MKLRELVIFNPQERLPSDDLVPFIDMAALPQMGRDIDSYSLREPASSGSRFVNGDTLLARITPCLENGKGAQVRILPEGSVGQGSTEFIVLRPIRPSDSDFVYYVSRNPDFRSHAIRQMTGTSGRQRVAWQAIADYELPDIGPFQRKAIASVLGALDDKIDLNRRMNETLEAMARAIFRDWFVDFGPTRAKMAMRGEDPQKDNVARAPYLAPEIWSLFPDRLDDDGKPEGWEGNPLTKFFSIIGGGTPKTSTADFWGGPIPWFSVTDTPTNGSVFVTDTEKTISAAGLNGSSARLVPKGTTIISARGTVGNLAVAGRDMTFNQSCYGLRGTAPVGDYATYLIAQNMVSQLQARAHGSVFSTITRQTFESLSLPMPSHEVLAVFEDAVAPLFDKILANVNESRTLAAMRDLLLPKLMSGELRVKDVERLVETAQ